MDTFGEYAYKVRSYECGVDGNATLATICNYLQESASANAEKLGFSKRDFNAAGNDLSWVLTRLRVRIRRYPQWDETVKVLTFPRGGRKVVAWRDFQITDGAGEVIALAASEWMIINLATRKLMALPESVFAAANTERKPVLGAEPFARFRFPAADGVRPPMEFVAQNSHIDLNGHVNNVHYVEWMLEPCPQRRPKEVEMVFRSETFAGERVLVSVSDGAAEVCYHRVCAADGTEHISAVTRI